jgi:peroxiredoxin
MSLQAELDAIRAEFVRAAPPGRAALHDARVEELRRAFPIEKSLRTGDLAPDFILPNAFRRFISLGGLLRSGPAVVTFYHGGWCPGCNPQLRGYQQALGEIAALGGKLVAISPQLPGGSRFTAETNRLSFDVLSDFGNRVARSFGLVYALPNDLRAPLTSNNKALPGIDGNDSWELPVPATYVIAPDRKIVFAEIELGYRQRLEPGAIVAALLRLCSIATKAA